jgi:ribokinase
MILPRVIVAGSVNMDVTVRVRSLPSAGETVSGSDAALLLGGKGANQAVAAARLGAQAHLIARIGGDGFGSMAGDALRRESMDLSHLHVTPDAATGVALITVAQDGQNMITLSPGANALLSPVDVDRASELFREGAVLLLQNEIPAAVSLHAARIMRERGGVVIADPAPAAGFDPALLASTTIVTPNETEAATLSGISVCSSADAMAAARWFVGEGAACAIVKWGANGVVYAGRFGEGYMPAPQVAAVDTVAAGDCFNGALAVALGEGVAFVDALSFACRAASISVTRLGASSSMPRRSEI